MPIPTLNLNQLTSSIPTNAFEEISGNIRSGIQGGSEIIDIINSRKNRLLKKNINNIAIPPTVKFNTSTAENTDWRIRLVDRSGKYYQGPLLNPLAQTGGMIFPYTPQIGITHTSNWNPQLPIHSNFPVKEYANSQVDNIIITGDFTAQNHEEARYCLAVIHFTRSISKMNFGQDADAGTPPPLLFLEGLGAYMLPQLPVVVLSTYLDLPADVDYLTVNVNGIPTKRDIGARPGFEGFDGPEPAELISGNLAKIPTQFSLNVTLGIAHSRESTSTVFSLNDFLNGGLIGGDDFGGYI